VTARKRRRRPRPQATPETAARATAPEEEESDDREPERPARRPGLFGGALFAGESALPPIGRSLWRGVLGVITQPLLVVLSVGLVAATWLVLVAIGFEGAPGRLVDVLALPPISTYFDLGTGSSRYGIGGAFLVFLGVTFAVRTIVISLLAGFILEALEDGRVTRYGLLMGVSAMPALLVVHVLSFSLIVAGNLVFPVLGPGIGFLGSVAALVGGLFFLGFVPYASMRERRPVVETVRRSGRAAMLPGGRHLLLCCLYFFLALPVVVGFAPQGAETTANPELTTWVAVFLVNVVHLIFMAALAYRWVIAEPSVPEEPVRRRAPARAPSARARSRG
jgi:hypothetical protein